jgi:hypothetical protein
MIQALAYAKMACVLFILLLASSLLQAQGTTADVVGTVTDASGAVVAGAKVTITNLGTGIAQTSDTGQGGEYIANLLPVGSYSLVVEKNGYKTYDLKQFMLAAGDRARFDVKLQVGEVVEKVEVESQAVTLQSDTSEVSSLITPQSVQDMPLNGRNLNNLVQLTAGVTIGVQNLAGLPDDKRQSSDYSTNGENTILNTNMMDGMDNNERFIGTVGVKPSIDSIQEVQVETNLYSADVGRTMGGVVNIVTKSGTNKIKGSAFEFFRNDIFDSNNYFTPRPTFNELRQNDFGGSLGGPIKKDKTFFFADYEGFRQVAGQPASATVPTTTMMDAVTSGNDISADVFGVAIPAASISSLGEAIFEMYPTPNVAGLETSNPDFLTNFNSTPKFFQVESTVDARVDQHFGKDTLFGRYTINDVTSAVPGGMPGEKIGSDTYYPGGSYGSQMYIGNSKQRDQHIGLDYVHPFSPNVVLELKAGYLRFGNWAQTLNGPNAATNLGFQCTATACINDAPAGTIYGLPSFSIGSLTGVGDGMFSPLYEVMNDFQYTGSLIWNRGAHSFKLGAGLIRRQVDRQQSFAGRGMYNMMGTSTLAYNAGLTGTTDGAIVDLLLGEATSASQQGELVFPQLRSWEPSVYVQDDWRVEKWLTLNLGVRYDVFTPYTEKHGDISNLDTNLLLLVSPNLPGVQKSSATAGVQTEYRDVAPRIGFAFSLPQKTVLRGGFGISYSQIPFGSQGSETNEPYEYGINCGNPLNGFGTDCSGIASDAFMYNMADKNLILQNALPVPNIANSLPLATNPANYVGTSIDAVSQTMHSSYVEQYSLGLEKQLGANLASLGYIGNLGRQEPLMFNINLPVVAGGPWLYLPGTSVSMSTNGSTSNYNAMQATLQRRMSAGLDATVNYTWAHSIMMGSIYNQGSSPSCVRYGCIGDTPSHQTYIINGWKQYDLGNGENDIRGRLTAMVSYQLPFGKTAHGVEGAAIKGWSSSLMGAWQSGIPFNITNQSGRTGISGVQGDRPNQVGDPYKAGTVSAYSSCTAPSQIHTVTAWFNPCAFEPEAPDTFGDAGYNKYRGPHYYDWDISFAKTFSLNEDMKLQFRAEGFNFLNHPNFGLPGAGISCETGPNVPTDAACMSGGGGGPGGPPPPGGGGPAGQITSTQVGSNPRQIQFALKLTF